MTGPAQDPQAPRPQQPLRRRDAARHLLHPQQIRGSMNLSAHPSLRNATLAGLQAGVTAAIALPLLHLSPWSHLIGFGALGVLVALFGRFAPPRRRGSILLLCGLLQVLAVFGMSSAAWLGAPMALQLILLALSCGLFLFISTTGKFGPPGPLIFVFAAGASMSVSITLPQVLERTAATAIVAALALAICLASEALRHHETPERPFPAEPQRPLGHRLNAATRSVIGAAIAVFVSYAFGANHPAWAAMGALAVMQGAHLHISMDRALQRMAGTMVGAFLAWLLLVQEPSVWTVIAVLVVTQIATEIVIGINYAFGQVLVTPMALLMTYLGAAHIAGPEIAPERVLDTMLGAAVGIGMAVLLSTIDDRRHLAELRKAKTVSGD